MHKAHRALRAETAFVLEAIRQADPVGSQRLNWLPLGLLPKSSNALSTR